MLLENIHRIASRTRVLTTGMLAACDNHGDDVTSHMHETQQSAPVITSVAISPESPTAADTLRCTARWVTDAEDDSGVSVRWTVDGAHTPSPDGTLANVPRGSVVQCFAKPSDPNDGGIEVASPNVMVVNAVPRIKLLELTPKSLIPTDTPSCSWTFSDADGDLEQSAVSWTVDGVPSGTTSRLSAPLVPGDEVVCTVTPDDGDDVGKAVSVAAVVGPSLLGGNILVVLLDDVGVDVIPSYGVGTIVPATPVIDSIVDEGVLFSSAYGNTVCSPTRATIQTGLYAFRTGVTAALGSRQDHWLLESETTLPEMLEERAPGLYENSYIGKWHLGSKKATFWEDPNIQGWSYYAGLINGFDVDGTLDGLPQTYFDWEKTVNGVVTRTSTYVTTDNFNEAIDRMAIMSEPWLLMVAPNAAHAPTHWPPAELWSGVATGTSTAQQKYHAMIEAADTELGRLLDAMTPAQHANTTIIVLADNGTYSNVVSPPIPSDQVKGTPYELGNRIPLVIAGPFVDSPGSVTEAFVQTTDLYATIAEIAGVGFDPTELANLDSISLVRWLRAPDAPTVRRIVYSEKVTPIGYGPYTAGAHSVRNARWRLVEGREIGGFSRELYDLDGVDWEGTDLIAAGPLDPEAQDAYDSLLPELPYSFELPEGP